MKEYVFSGVWSYSCYANSEEEAWKKFDGCDLDEMCLYTDYVEIEEIGEDEK